VKVLTNFPSSGNWCFAKVELKTIEVQASHVGDMYGYTSIHRQLPNPKTLWVKNRNTQTWTGCHIWFTIERDPSNSSAGMRCDYKDL